MELSAVKSISVIVCTFDRYDHLRALFASLEQQTLGREFFDVIVVDNTPDAALKADFQSEVPAGLPLRYLRSTPPGLSRARNLGFETAKTPFVVFIDDDALPDPGWLASLHACLEKNPEAACICGPIVPIWPSEEPSWVPAAHRPAFTILDYGRADRILKDHEFGFGANLGFSTAALKAVGGFDERLGRSGHTSLMSGEEMRVQEEILKAGGLRVYCAGAIVQHHVHADRLERNWLRSRMAWQSVSELVDGSDTWDQGYVLNALKQHADTLGVAHLVDGLLDYKTPQQYEAQLSLIRFLVRALLSLNKMPDGRTERGIAGISGKQSANFENAISRASIVVPRPEPRAVFVDFTPGHPFLYDEYGDIDGAHLINVDHDSWGCTQEDVSRTAGYLDAARDSLNGARKRLFFLTLDQFFYGPASVYFAEFCKDSSMEAFGILHRMPDSERKWALLKKGAPGVERIYVLSVQMQKFLEDAGIQGVATLPHHPTVARYICRTREEIRSSLGIGPDVQMISLVGEARDGKGYEFLPEVFRALPARYKERCYFLFGGSSRRFDVEGLREVIHREGIRAHLDLKKPPRISQYAVLSDAKYAEYVFASDLGLLLYTGDQRNCMSGALPNYAWFDIPVLSTENSFVGKEVAANKLGRCIVRENAESIVEEIIRFVDRPSCDWGFAEYKRLIDPENVRSILKRDVFSGTEVVLRSVA